MDRWSLELNRWVHASVDPDHALAVPFHARSGRIKGTNGPFHASTGRETARDLWFVRVNEVFVVVDAPGNATSSSVIARVAWTNGSHQRSNALVRRSLATLEPSRAFLDRSWTFVSW